MTLSAPPDRLISTIATNVAVVRARIDAAAWRADRNPADVRLIGVTKTFPAEVCNAALRAGVVDLGENRVQEGVAKAATLAAAGLEPTWHLIGHLQSNKVRPALEVFSLIHSVDSIDLAGAISRRATRPTEILLEVNVGDEPTKFGFPPQAVGAALEAIMRLSNLSVRGLMTVAPASHDPESVRPIFAQLRELARSLALRELSMGMSGDYEVAVEEGSTMVRVGSALFGARPAPVASS